MNHYLIDRGWGQDKDTDIKKEFYRFHHVDKIAPQKKDNSGPIQLFLLKIGAFKPLILYYGKTDNTEHFSGSWGKNKQTNTKQTNKITGL